MLVQKLYPGQPLKIGDGITITVLRGFEDAWLVLGIEAPADLKIERGPRPPAESDAGLVAAPES